MTDVAAELPLQAIAEIMGVPQEERHLLFDWSNRLDRRRRPGVPEGGRHQRRHRGGCRALHVRRPSCGRSAPNEPRDDVVTKLINGEINGDKLTEAEFDMFVLLLVVAGNETTRNATAHGMHALMTNPDEFAKLRANPELMPGADRGDPPVGHARCCTSVARRCVRSSCRDKKIEVDDKVIMWHISANRDEEVFEDPFRFDIERTPNDHIAFGGGGAHFCLGANLARMELRLIFDEINERLGDMQLAGEPERLRSNFIGGIKHMPVTFTPGPRRHAEDAAA